MTDQPIPSSPGEPDLCRPGTTDEHARTLAALRERVKELDCLYEITRLSQCQEMNLDDILAGACGIVVKAWQYPEIACARVVIGGRLHATGNVRRTVSRQSSLVRAHGEVVGRIEVGYLEKRPECDEGPFLREERHLLDAVADHLGRIIEARKNEEQLRLLSRELIKAQENERQRIARELHDEVAQKLSMVRMDLDRLPQLLTVPESGDGETIRECPAGWAKPLPRFAIFPTICFLRPWGNSACPKPRFGFARSLPSAMPLPLIFPPMAWMPYASILKPASTCSGCCRKPWPMPAAMPGAKPSPCV